MQTMNRPTRVALAVLLTIGIALAAIPLTLAQDPAPDDSFAQEYGTLGERLDARFSALETRVAVLEEQHAQPGTTPSAEPEPSATATETATPPIDPTATETAPPSATATTGTQPIDTRTIVVSSAPDRSNPSALDGTNQTGTIYVHITAGNTEIADVTWTLDDGPARFDDGAPYDLIGGNATAALPLDTATLAPGPHTVTAQIKPRGSAAVTRTATFTVGDQPAPTATPQPSATSQPTTTTTPTPTPSPVAGAIILTANIETISVTIPGAGNGTERFVPMEWREAGADTWTTGHPVWIDPETSEGRGVIVGLDPDTPIEVRVGTATAGITTRASDYADGTGPTIDVETADEFRSALSTAGPGTTIRLAPGIYPGPFTLNRSGAAGNYLTIEGPDDGTRSAVLTGNAGAIETVLTLDGADYVRIRGLTIRDADKNLIQLLNGSDDAIIENNAFIEPGYGKTLEATTNAAIHLRQDSARPIVRRNTFHRETEMTTKIGVQAFFAWKAGSGAIITDNTVTGGFEDAFRWGPENDVTGSQSADIDIARNTIDGACYDDAIQPEGIARNVRIWGNTITRCFIAIALAPTMDGPVWVFRNTMTDLEHPNRGGSGAYKLGDENEDRRGGKFFYHNTIDAQADPTTVTGYKQTNSGLGRVTSRNNIVIVGRYVWEGGCAPECDLDYDAMTTTDPSRFAEYRGPRYSSMAEWCAATGQECNGIELDPDAPDLTQVIDRGAIIPGFNDAGSAWPYQGTAPDIGAVEEP